jgi:hypothetical protein
MTELKFINRNIEKESAACCGSEQSVSQAINGVSCKTSLPAGEKDRPGWITGYLMTAAGEIPIVLTDLSGTDKWEHIKCRISSFRNDYAVDPGLYAVGMPDRNSDVFVSANYKLSFDALRKALKGLNAWLLVLDTKGINVWCAAGKGTFGTDELIRSISVTNISRVVAHRRIIVPQLGAPGVSAHMVRKATGFRVYYGPVRAEDIGDYVSAGYAATRQMRTVTFPFIDRLILTPMEFNPAMKKYYPWYALIIFIVFGLQTEGILFRDALAGGSPFLILGLLAIISGALITPAFLPFIPFRSFALKGWLAGLISVFLAVKISSPLKPVDMSLLFFTYLFFPLASSYVALQFTGSTTFTGMSGVKRELKISIPVYLFGTVISIFLLILYKFGKWGLI